MTKAIDKLTDDDKAALRAFAARVSGGVRWKGKLRDAWMTGVYPGGLDPNTKAALQSIRNRLGTSWLSQYKFTGYR